MKLSIIIPAYNEEKRIGRTLEEYQRFFGLLRKQKVLDFEIVIVLNACRDNTLKVVKRFADKNKGIIYLDFKTVGKGFAIIEGFKDVLKRDNDLIGFVDADMSTTPKLFYELVDEIGGYDGVIASRWLKESKTRMSLLRKIVSRGFNFIVRSLLLLPHTDTQCGAKLFKKKTIEVIVKNIKITEWAFDVDLLYISKKSGFKIKEVSTVWEDAEGSNINLSIIPIKMFSSIVRLRLIYSPFKFIVRLYDKMPEKIKIHNL